MPQVIVLLCLTISIVHCEKSLPNIVFILADDVGYNDVPWHNENIQAPNINELARNGVILENHYVLPLCSPTRASLMTGYYPIHTGQQTVIKTQEGTGVYTNFKFMPEYLKTLGYNTHALGKWHLGFCNEAYLPTRRGFDTFNGYYNCPGDAFTHMRWPSIEGGGGPPGYDFRSNEQIDYEAKGTYSSQLIAKYSSQIIKNATIKNKPFFMYVAYQDAHAPLVVPDEYLSLYANDTNEARRLLSAKVSAMDDSIGAIISALKENNLYEDTLIVFTSDNGGNFRAGGSNWPLRGNKNTIWEGGTRSAAFVHGPKILGRSGEISKKLMHVTDWIPTLLSMAGSPNLPTKMDGINQWKSLINPEEPSARTEMVYDMSYDDTRHVNGSAIRYQQWKLIMGDPGSPNGWIHETTVLNHNAFGLNIQPEYHDMSDNALIRLYNLDQDPLEKVNVAQEYPYLVKWLGQKIERYKKTMIAPNLGNVLEAGNPNRNGGIWGTNWCEAKSL